ncbi:MAG: IclR family transcriptional regulator [Acidimicrobiales bacterium]
MEQIVSGVGVLDKSLSILGVLEQDPCGLAELTVRTGLPRATAHRLAVALEQHGMVRRDVRGDFCLGPRLLGLAQAAQAALPLAELAGPILEELRAATSESVQLFVREGDVRVCIRSLDSLHELRTIVRPGARLPLGIGSAGRILAGEQTKTGWIATVAERASGVASVSAAVLGADGVSIAAVSVSGPIERLGRTPGKAHGAAVVFAAQELGLRIRQV